AEPRSSVDYDRAVVARPLGDHLARGRFISFGPGTIVHARLAQRRKYATISLDPSDALARCTRQSADHRSPCHGYERLSRRSTAKTSTSSHLRKSLRRVQSTGRQGKRFLSPSLVRRNGAGCRRSLPVTTTSTSGELYSEIPAARANRGSIACTILALR